MITQAPSTPRRPRQEDIDLKINAVVSSLSREWDLRFEVPKPNGTPSRRERTLEEECVFKIKYLTFKNAIDPVVRDFSHQADIVYSRWVHKPKGERGTVPERTRHKPHPVSDRERLELQLLFREIVSREYDQVKNQERGTPLSQRQTPTWSSFGGPDSLRGSRIDDTPIPSKLPSSGRKNSLKRAAEGFHDGPNPFKRGPKPATQQTLNFSARALSSDRGNASSKDQRSFKSANTSFVSDVSSVWDRCSVSNSRGSMPVFLSQTTVPDDEVLLSRMLDTGEPVAQNNSHSSEYEAGSSFDEALAAVADSFKEDNADGLEAATIRTEVDEDLSRNWNESSRRSDGALGPISGSSKEDNLRRCLENIFPEMPSCLLSTPLHVRYEILRVYLHTGAPLTGLTLPASPNWENYDSLWAFLRRLPALKGMVFPERSSREAWAACQDEFRRGSRGVAMLGSLRYHERSSNGPLFRFQLEPLRLERTYRLRRRFGNDRFLELDIPNLVGRRLPKVLQDCPNGKSIIIDWFFEKMHHILGRVWMPFCTKRKEGKERKLGMEQQNDLDVGVAHRAYFFAVDGHNFCEKTACGISDESETVNTRSRMSVEAMLNWLRPTWENRKQSAYKLYARTPLALSRNTPTVVLNRSQIRYKKDLLCNGEVMTDGAGRMSLTLASKIVKTLGLSYLPSGFQARIGGAKGFWSIDPSTDHASEEWIEIYESQLKWTRKGTLDDWNYNDPAHRTFEVNKFSGKLKSADLNAQLLPILIDRAKSKPRMVDAISKLLEDGLMEEIKSQRVAMENPQSFRKWIRETNPGLTDRVKHGMVQYKASLPVSLEEKLNMFLDAGFDPMKLTYLEELSRQHYTQKCDELKKRLNIPVPRSAYAFMVPDFAGVLEPDEVYIHFSESFVDDMSPLSGLPLKDIDVIVTRSPAHYPSDVQRVRAVVKFELMGLKDVIVFSTKGNPSLAAKLSGGDYDGDQALICWEPSIVENFENSRVPKFPDLVKEGYIHKDTTTYEELVKDAVDPTTTFLKRCFDFNLDQSMLGICTNYKEELCYTQKKVNSMDAVYLSTLLSLLVDQAKQGYVFTQDDWDRFRKEALRGAPRMVPLYKKGELDPKATHIIDRLMYVADRTIERARTDFYKSMQKTSYWDNDLTLYSGWAHREALENPEWSSILSKLKADIESVKAIWNRKLAGSKNEEKKSIFTPVLMECYELFQAIQPVNDTMLTRTLLESWHGNPELSRWALLRASVAFASFPEKYVSSFVWWMAGTQLCHLKATRLGGMVAMAPHMNAMLRPDNTFVKLRLSEEKVFQWEDDNDDTYGVNDDDD